MVSSVSQAQEWAPEGARWYYTQFTMMGGHYPVRVDSYNDTVIQSKSCRILKYTTDIGPVINQPFKQFIYEDAQKLYFFDTLMGTFHTLYDFQSDTGTSWILPISYIIYRTGGDTMGVDSFRLTIKEKDSVMMNGKKLGQEKLEVDYIGSGNRQISVYPGTLEVTEFIGPTNAFLFPWNRSTDEYYIQGIRCYEDSYIGNYAWVTHECDLGVIQPNPELAFKLFPNPATSSFTIQFQTQPRQIPDIKIYDMTGKQCADIPWNSIGQSISVGGFTPGLYLVKIGSHTEKLLIR
jgi:hypothetical protein